MAIPLRRFAAGIALAVAVTGPVPGAAQVPLADCPMAGLPYSVEAPLIDVLASDAAVRAVEEIAPGALARIPAPLRTGKAPSLATILNLRIVAPLAGISPATLSAIDRALASVPVTAAADLARCARYDVSKPARVRLKRGRPAILVFEHSTGFRDVPSVEAAKAALLKMAAEQRWQLIFSDRPGIFNTRDLARFDAVVWNNVSGDVLTFGQRAAFEAYIAKGGGYVGFHGSAGDPLTFWDWYVDTLVGARFAGHPMAPQFQAARVVVDDPTSTITAGLGHGWTMTDEWYSFRTSPRLTGARVLLTLDETSYSPVGLPGQQLRMGDHPIAWTRCVGAGRSFYSAIGHLPEAYADRSAMRLLRQGIEWAAKLRHDARACQES